MSRLVLLLLAVAATPPFHSEKSLVETAGQALPAFSMSDEQDELEFARVLVAEGYTDLALEIYNNIKNEAKNELIKTQAEAGLVSLNISLASKIKDAAERFNAVRAAVKQLEEATGKSLKTNSYYVLISELMFQYQALAKELYEQRKFKEAEDLLDSAAKIAEKYMKDLDGDPDYEVKAVLCKFYFVENMVKKVELLSQVKTVEEIWAVVKKVGEFIDRELGLGWESYPATYAAMFAHGKALHIYAMRIQETDAAKAVASWEEAIERYEPISTYLTDYADSPTVQGVILKGTIDFIDVSLAYSDFRRKRGGDFKSVLSKAQSVGEIATKRCSPIGDPYLEATLYVKRAEVLSKLGMNDLALKLIKGLLDRTTNPGIKDMLIRANFAASTPEQMLDLAKKDLDDGRLFNALAKLKPVLSSSIEDALKAEALLALATCYKETTRYFEAVEIFKEIEAKYSSLEDIYREAVLAKYDTLSHLIAIVKSDSLQQELAKTEKVIMERKYPNRYLLIRVANDYERKREYGKAQKIWKDLLASDKPDKKEEDRYNILRLEYLSFLGDRSKGADPALKASDEYFAAVNELKNKNKAVEGREIQAYSMLCELYSRLGKHAEIIQKTDGVIANHPDADPKFTMRILLRRIEALCETDAFAKAEDEFTRLKQIFESSKTQLSVYRNALITLYTAAKESMDKAEDADAKNLYRGKFVYYFTESQKLGGGGSSKAGFDEAVALLGMTFNSIVFPKHAFDNPSEASKSSARQVREGFEGLLINSRAEVTKRNLEDKIGWYIALCYYVEEDYNSADKEVQALLTKHGKDVDYLLLKADIAVRKAMKEDNAQEKEKLFTNALQLYGQVKQGIKDRNENYYRAIYCGFRTLLASGKIEEFRAGVNAHIQLNGSEWDGGKFGYKQLFQKLSEEAGLFDRRR